MAATHLPPASRLPGPVQAAAFLADPVRMLGSARRKHGPTFCVQLPMFGRSVVLSEPGLIKELFATPSTVAGNMDPNLGRILGEGSVFNLDHDPHRRRRKVLVPPFHGRRMKSYEDIVVSEARREFATWPHDEEFATAPGFMRITLNVILRAVFGAEGAEFDRLRALLPRMVERGSRLMLAPIPRSGGGPLNPWHQFLRDRQDYDEIVSGLIARAEADPELENRADVLAMLVRSSYEDGTRMDWGHIADELLTMLAAGHETTANTLAFAVERLTRHPVILRQLVKELDAGGNELMEATLLEVQRSRPVIGLTFRKVVGDVLELGEWRIPKGWNVVVGIDLMHHDPDRYPFPERFDPSRFLRNAPDWSLWIPFGGGTRRCIGAAFAEMEMAVVLRTLLREFDVRSTTAPGEGRRFRGVALAPAKGGRVTLRPRTVTASATVSDRSGDSSLQ
jgi:cytochrome P450